MSASGPKSLPAIGFLTVVEQAEAGLLGGYLVLNALGRPLEFHCTAPVKANRAQQILYGPTLAPYLYGEQIGQTLLGKTKVEPLLVFTDVSPALAVRNLVTLPVLLVQSATDKTVPESNIDVPPTGLKLNRHDDAHPSVPYPKSARLIEFQLARQSVAVLASHAADRERAAEVWQPYAEEFDLEEPFSRIREALNEAQRGGK
jgi:hypothetical protein